MIDAVPIMWALGSAAYELLVVARKGLREERIINVGGETFVLTVRRHQEEGESVTLGK